ncbi:MAG: 4Fe-4S single cluster domain-containing protein [Bryobacteraceae bacterium]
MLIHGFVAHSRVNGPGARAVVYFQGCNLGCAGCWNPATHSFVGTSRGVQDVAEQVATAHQTQFIEGVTFSGGEPMQQAPDLLALIRLLKRTRPEISIGMYSGYTERELDGGRFWTHDGIAQETRRRIWADFKQHLDFAVLGRFVAARPSKLPMRTSANQVLRLFSDRYREEHFNPLEFEVNIESAGLVQITGFPLAGLPV